MRTPVSPDRPRRWLTAVALLLLLPIATANAAPPPAEGETDVLDLYLENGWEIAAPGVLSRQLAPGPTEYLVFSPQGLEWEKARVRARVAELAATYEAYDDPEVLEALESLRGSLEQLDRDIARETSGPSYMAAPAVAQECILTAARSADAYPQLYGPAATASASFSETCNARGCTYALAFAEGYDGTVYNSRTQRQDDACDDGTAPAASVSVDDVIANNNCEAYAIGRVKVQDSQQNWAYFITEDTDTTCRTPLTVEISGANAFSVGYGHCRTFTWSTTTNRTPTTWAWTWDTVAVGSASTYSRPFCSWAKYTYTRSYNLGVTVGDGYDSASDTDTVTVTYYGYNDCQTPVADDVAKSTAYSLAGCSVQ